MTHTNRPPFVDAMFDDVAWRNHVANVGLIGARTELTHMKAELRIQRREHQGDFEFINRQARFEKVLQQRLREVESSLTANPEPSGRKYRQRISELTDLVGHLAKAIDETDLEYLLDDFEIPFGDDWMTLSDALDAKRFDRSRHSEGRAA